MNSNWEFLGYVSINTGSIFIGDPCEIIERYKKFKDWLDELERNKLTQRSELQYHSKADDGRNYPSFVQSGTGYGDGCYKVWVKKNEEGRVMQIKIDFETMWGYEKKGQENHDIIATEIYNKLKNEH